MKNIAFIQSAWKHKRILTFPTLTCITLGNSHWKSFTIQFYRNLFPYHKESIVKVIVFSLSTENIGKGMS